MAPMSTTPVPVHKLAAMLRKAVKALATAPERMPPHWGEPPPGIPGDAKYQRQVHRKTP